MLVEGESSQELSQLFINYTKISKHELIKNFAKNLERGVFFLVFIQMGFQFPVNELNDDEKIAHLKFEFVNS